MRTAQALGTVFTHCYAAMRPIRTRFSCIAEPDGAALIDRVALMQKAEDDMSASAMNPGHPGYELRFRSVFRPGRGLSFNCDSNGNVDLGALSERARCNYLYARTVVGSEFFIPLVQPRDLH